MYVRAEFGPQQLLQVIKIKEWLFVMKLSVFFVFLAQLCLSNGQSIFRFANPLGSNMVLQQAPYRAQIWGFSPENSVVSVALLFGHDVVQITDTVADSNNMFSVYLNPMPASFNSYSIVAMNDVNSSSISLNNIVFGDVYICSGQSNMQLQRNLITSFCFFFL